MLVVIIWKIMNWKYPEIFEDELTEASKQIDILINKYIYLSK